MIIRARFCKNEHDTLEVGRRPNGQCRECWRIQARARNRNRPKGPRYTGFKKPICPQGHDKRILGAAANGGCLQCKKDSAPKTPRVVCAHPGECERRTDRLDRSYCQTQRKWAEGQRKLNPGSPPPVLDGFEEEFGPVPPKVHEAVWVDRVALARRLQGEDVGRHLTPGETRALHLLAVLRGPQASVPAYHQRGTLILTHGGRL